MALFSASCQQWTAIRFHHRPKWPEEAILSVFKQTSTAGLLLAVALCSCSYAARYSGDFEQLGTSARATGMGGAAVASASDPSAIYYNPSLSSRFERTEALFLHSEDFSGLVKHNYLGISFRGQLQSLGLAVLHNGVPGIKLTELPNETLPPGENNRPRIKSTVSANQLVGYVNYARTLNPYLTLGGNAKVIYQNLSVGSCFGMGLDLGATVTPMSDLDVGMRCRNISTSPLFWDTGTREYIEPSIALGLAKTFRMSRDRLTLAFESEANLEGTSLSPSMGVEYAFRNVLFGRLGVYHGNLSFGLGLKFKRIHIDYGYASGIAPDAREMGSPQQVSGGVEF